MVRSSPRASAGLRRFAASPAPAAPPAPISVWASSIKMMIGTGDDFTSSMTDFRRFSNSPLIPGPRLEKSEVEGAQFHASKGRGARHPPLYFQGKTFPPRPFLPTPASPVRIGLFCLRSLIRISTICLISSSPAQNRIRCSPCALSPSG